MLKKIIKNIAWLSGDQVLRLAVSFVVGAWVARYLQPTQYGLLNYALAFVSLFAPFANLNELNQIVVRDITLEPEAKNKILGTTFFLKLLGSFITILLSIVSILVLRPDDKLAQSLVIILSFNTLFSSCNTIDCWFQYQIQSKYTVIAKNITFTILTFLRITLIHFNAPLVAFAWVITIEAALSAIAVIIAYNISGQTLKAWRSSFLTAKKLLKDSWGLILSGFAIAVYLKIDQTMLGQIVDDKAVGIYSVAVRLAEICCILPTPIIASFTSSIIEAKSRSDKEFYEQLQKLFDLMIVLAYSIAIVMCLIAKPAILLVYGKYYEAAGDVVLIHVWSIIFVFMGITKSIWIIAENQGIYALIFTFLGAAINILLNFWLIPKYQEIGAAIATLISYGFADYISCFLYPKANKIGWIITRSLTLRSHFSRIVRHL
jgi:polysaccharide transporter, PST family